MKTQSKIECKIYKSLTNNLIDEWKDLWIKSKSECIFNSYGWFISASEAFGYKEVRVLFFRDRSSGILLGVLPLVQMKFYGINIYTLPGIEFVDHYSLLIKKDKDTIKELIKSTLFLGTIYIPGILNNDVEFLTSEGFSKSFVLDDNPYIELNDEFNNVLNKKKKSRHLKKAERDFGSVKFQTYSNNKEAVLDDIIAIENNSSKTKKGKSIFNNQKNQIFFKRLANEMGDNLLIELLFFSNKPVAYNIGFACNGVCACSQKAHLKEYDKYRPGGVMFLKFLEAVSLNNPKEIDIGRGIDSFKMEYASAIRKLYGVVISKNKFKILYFVAVRRLREKMYKLVSGKIYLYVLYSSIKDMLSSY